jgi:2-(1,2-epoxy-1,2-dihydrophenyl)acetyl-CoA isomerase
VSEGSEPSAEAVLVDRDQDIATITLNRPSRLNALTPEMRDRLLEVLASLDADRDVRAIVLTGAGRGFCGGLDFAALSSSGTSRPDPDGRRSVPLDYPMHMTTPLIAAINGAVAGVGMAYALMADVRFAAEGAKWVAPYAQLGLVAEMGMAWLLQRLVGRGSALDIMLSGEPFLSEEAYRLGLAQRILPPAEVLPAAQTYARRLAANSATSIRVIREQIALDAQRSWDEAFSDAFQRMTEALASDNFREAMRARSSSQRPSVS